LQEIVHLDFQSSASATKHADIAAYNILLYRQHLVPVHSIVILLRPQAAHPNLHGVVTYAARPGRGRMAFDYEVIRLWEWPTSELLAGDIGALPLAILGKLPPGVELQAGLADVVQRLIERLDREAPADKSRRLVTAAYVLAGLRVPRQVALELFKGVRNMRESDTYLAIVEEGMEKGMEKGRLEEVKKMILRLGRKTLGAPGKRATADLDAITDIDRLETLLERLSDVKTWRELLAR
jgi:predicted transposase YdaD